MSITTAGRSLSANMVTEVSASQLSPILLASFSFSTPVRLWSGYGTITVGSVTYLGSGSLGTISPVEETTDLAARGINFQLSGVPTALVAVALSENYQGKECSVHHVRGGGARNAEPCAAAVRALCCRADGHVG